ncbi:MAG: hypothetical protein JXA11_04185 [Phycisphaerae bacterium]|nr:hypothetical protein [Phycisphaerae bacterium]
MRNACVGLLMMVLLGLSGTAGAAYTYGYEWDFVDDFSNTTAQPQDSEGNVAWEYRCGAWDTAPSGAGLYSTWADWLSPPAWQGSTNPSSLTGQGFLKACQPGVGDQYPFLVWVSNVTGQVQVEIDLTNADGSYQASVFMNDSTLSSSTSGSSEDWSYSDLLDVTAGDKITLRFGSWGNYPTVDADFTVTYLPEPTTMGLLVFGGIALLRRGK